MRQASTWRSFSARTRGEARADCDLELAVLGEDIDILELARLDVESR